MKEHSTARLKPRFILMPAILSIALLFLKTTTHSQPLLGYSLLLQNLAKPVNITNAKDSSGRLFIVEQPGTVRIFKNGVLLNKPFLDISPKIRLKKYKGLWSIAFSPNYKKNRTFFVLYDDLNGNTILARYKTSLGNPDSADIKSGKIMLSLPEIGGLGDMHFGKDKYLYISLDDGSFVDSTTGRAQNLGSYFGKILRIAVEEKNPPYYSIPPDNPFINTPNALKEIWAYGLRNAWKWSFDRSNGNLWIADVGGAQWEEINIRTPTQIAGYNYGWPCYEGNTSFIPTDCNSTSNYVFPNYIYPHDSSFGGECIVGGCVYRGKKYPALRGYYICSDYVSNNAWRISQNDSGGLNIFLQNAVPPNIVSYGEDEDGEIYATALDGKIYKIAAAVSSQQSSAALSTIQQDKTVGVRIYPTLIRNNKFTIEQGDGFTSLGIYNLAGNKVFSQPLDGSKANITITLPDLSTGIYFVRLSGTHFFQQKIFISK